MTAYTAMMVALMLFAGVGVGILLIALVELYLYSRPAKERDDG